MKQLLLNPAEYPEKAHSTQPGQEPRLRPPHPPGFGSANADSSRCMGSPCLRLCASLTLQEATPAICPRQHVHMSRAGQWAVGPRQCPTPAVSGTRASPAVARHGPPAFHRSSDVLDNAPYADRFAPRDRPWERRRSADRSGCRPSRADVHRVVGLLRCTDGPGVDQSRVVALNRCNGRTERHRPHPEWVGSQPSTSRVLSFETGLSKPANPRDSRGISAPPPR